MTGVRQKTSKVIDIIFEIVFPEERGAHVFVEVARDGSSGFARLAVTSTGHGNLKTFTKQRKLPGKRRKERKGKERKKKKRDVLVAFGQTGSRGTLVCRDVVGLEVDVGTDID